VTTTIVVFPN